MTKEELDFIGSMNMCDEISNEAYKKIVCHCREQEPCPDAISRQEAIEAMYKMHVNGKEGVLHDLKTETGSNAFFVETIADSVEALEELPSVNAQPKTGHWIDTNSEDFEFHRVYKCSECGITEIEYPEGICRFRYCFNCGARMVEPQERSDKE